MGPRGGIIDPMNMGLSRAGKHRLGKLANPIAGTPNAGRRWYYLCGGLLAGFEGHPKLAVTLDLGHPGRFIESVLMVPPLWACFQARLLCQDKPRVFSSGSSAREGPPGKILGLNKPCF